MIQAVHDSRIDPRLRHLAQTLAYFADDHGRNIFPGVRTLMTALGQEERTVRAGLQDLLATDVLVRDGYHPTPGASASTLNGSAAMTRRLNTPGPRSVKRPAGANEKGPLSGSKLRRRTQAKPAPLCRVPDRSQPCTVVPATLHYRAANPAQWCRQPCTVLHLIFRISRITMN